MYFCYAPELDPPKWIQQEILDQIETKSLTRTSMDGGYKKPLKTLLDLVPFDQGAQKHFEETYDTNQIYGYQLAKNLEQKILSYYSDFLQHVPDEPKLTIVQMVSSIDYWKIHIDNLKTASLFCLIKNSRVARTTWWEPVKEFEHVVRPSGQSWRNKKGSPVFKHKCVPKAAMWADVGQMVLFDNNSAHSIDEMIPNSDRYIMTIGFVNISHDELVNCYRQWINATAIKVNT
jgi:hypothetical protein